MRKWLLDDKIGSAVMVDIEGSNCKCVQTRIERNTARRAGTQMDLDAEGVFAAEEDRPIGVSISVEVGSCNGRSKKAAAGITGEFKTQEGVTHSILRMESGNCAHHREQCDGLDQRAK